MNHVTIVVVLVTDGFAVIVHTVEHDVAMRVPAAGVAGYDVLCVSDTHAFHVFTGDFLRECIIIRFMGASAYTPFCIAI